MNERVSRASSARPQGGTSADTTFWDAVHPSLGFRADPHSPWNASSTLGGQQDDRAARGSVPSLCAASLPSITRRRQQVFEAFCWVEAVDKTDSFPVP